MLAFQKIIVIFLFCETADFQQLHHNEWCLPDRVISGFYTKRCFEKRFALKKPVLMFTF